MNYVELLAAYDKLEAEHCMVLESVVLDAETIHRLESELAALKDRAAVVIPEPMDAQTTERGAYGQACIRGFNACIREFKRLNAAAPAQPQSDDAMDGLVDAVKDVLDHLNDGHSIHSGTGLHSCLQAAYRALLGGES